ncbi:MAG TPA: alpha-glucosidase/alpha-galactosidase [Candidatus Atribacteria bacterium]|nr:alpha-glucosidase/alpha-galactosidase [Candidatus Atribacteria bacterium]
MSKITIIGAGSGVFTRNLVRDILSYPELSGSTISLMDIDASRLEYMRKALQRLVEQEQYPAKLEATLNRKEALKGADYVILTIQVGGLKPFEHDIYIPLKYGVRQAVGDTIGPGGVFRALRTIPVILDIAKDMEELCPEALLLNYVNPMAMNCWALNQETNIKNVGLCHSVQGTAEFLAGIIGVSMEDISYLCAGINHMAWFLRFEANGKDAYPIIREKAKDPEIYTQDVTKFEVLRHFGYYVTESSFHLSEYVPYFRKSDDWINRIHRTHSWHKEYYDGMYLHCCLDAAKTLLEDLREMAEASYIDPRRSREYCATIIHSLETNSPNVINGNVENKGLITNLPEGCCVEVPCLVNRNGIQPTFVGNLPSQLAALNRTNINVQELAVTGALAADREAVYHAVMMDPLTSAVLDLDEIRQMVDEMFEAEKEYLPEEWNK